MEELLEAGRVPAPDRCFDGDITVSHERLRLDFAGDKLWKTEKGSYRLSLYDPIHRHGVELEFIPRKPALRHGDNGIVRGTSGEHMFYYFIPRCELTGTVVVDDTHHEVESGQGWYDHEFGGRWNHSETMQAVPSSSSAVQDLAWNWVGIQIENGWDITAYHIHELTGPNCGRESHRQTVGQWLVESGPAGERFERREFSFEPVHWWRSTRTFTEYPVKWRLHSPDGAIDLEIEAEFNDQEFITLISSPAFWEGRCRIRGRFHGHSVQGLGFVERSGFETMRDLDQFFGAVSQEVRASIARLLPTEPHRAQLRRLIANETTDHHLNGVDSARIAQALISPIRTITDRGGKAWRSYAALACCDVVGGDSRKFVQWLAMPELLHVGSLIVDDVQDGSQLRRGGASCHVLFGEAVAINAGTAAYFLGQPMLQSDELSDARKVRIYDRYFHAMRAGHAGQALDLVGVNHLMPEVVKTGETSTLELRIMACHRLKTGAPAACLAEMGAIAGGGQDVQIHALGDFFEHLGLAFQIVDDILNLRGFADNLKTRGEDLARGQVTLPFAKAMARLSPSGRVQLWSTFQSRTEEAQGIADMIGIIDNCGAMDACVEQATELIENAWVRVEPHLPDSMSKVMLRAFSWYVMERHY